MQKKQLLMLGVALITLALVWEFTASFYPDYLMPSLMVVLQRLASQILSSSFWETVKISLNRLLIGYSLALGIGLLSGLVVVPFKLGRLYLRSLISVLQSVPPIAWIPLLLILIGFGETSILVVIVVSCYFPIVLSVIDSVEAVDSNRIRVARLLGANHLQLISKVYIPEILPTLLTGAQIGFGNAWRSLISAEMLGGVNKGLGWSITFAGEIGDIAGVVMGIVAIGGLATLIDRMVITQIRERLLRWREEV